MSVRRLIEAFAAWRDRREPLVLATVYETLGSTYSKAGHRILITAAGDYQGLVSGGCLEGDLAMRAERALENGSPASVTYDMRDDVDALWGLGVGCNGLIRILLEPLLPARGYEPFASIAAAHLADGAAVATVLDDGFGKPPGGQALPPGAALIVDGGGARPLGAALPADWRSLLEAGCVASLDGGEAHIAVNHGMRVLYTPIAPVPRVLILGAGPDAVPVAELFAEVGWRVTVADHRPAYLARGGFRRADEVLEISPAALTERLDLTRFDGVLVMSHHLDTDQTYLDRIAAAEARPAYLGVLGPPARRAKLLAALGERGETLRPLLRGPVGLRIGADSPEAIALSIAGEMQSVFAEAPISRGRRRPVRAFHRPA